MPTPSPLRIAVIVNASSGSGDNKALADRLTKNFRAGGLDAHVTLATEGGEVIEAAQRAVHEKVLRIAAGGGDGTINAVASVLVGTEIALGILPLGTLNHFAKDLHIPLDVEEATRTIIKGYTIQVDVGEVNGRVFLNNSSLGLYPQLVRRRERQQEQLGRSKWPAFVWAALAVLRRYPFLHVRLRTDEQTLTRRTPFVFIGNNEYKMEGLAIGKRAHITGGQLSLYLSRRTGRLGLLRLALLALIGRLYVAEDFDALSAKDIIIETRRKGLHVATDGEVSRMSSPLHYRVRPGALRVIVPDESGSL